MTLAQPTPLRGATGRADLLRALAVSPREHLALDIGTDAWFGYVRRADTPSPAFETDSITADQTVIAAASPRKLPLRMPYAYVVAERQPRQPPEPDAQTAVIEAAGPITEDDAKAPSSQRLVGYEDLVPQARLLPALRRLLGSTRAGPLDVDRLIDCLASSQLPRHLPRRRLQRWHPEFVVLLDFSPRLWPYREDMHRLAERLLRHCGKSGVSLRIVNHGPFGPCSDWLAHQNIQACAEPAEKPWAMPPARTPVLIVSDLGLLHGSGTAAGTAWQGFIARLNQAQLRPVALVPLGAGQLDGSQALSLPILRWSPDARAHPERAHGVGQPRPEGLDDLLAMVAATRRVDPPLLRAMRRLNPQAPLDAGLEGAVWCHADVSAGASASIRTDAQETHLRRFAQLLPRLQLELEQLRHTHHAHLRAVLNHEETWLWQARADAGKAGWPAATRQRMAEADAFMAKLTATLRQSGNLRDAGVWWGVAQGIVQRADAAMGERYVRLLTPMAAALARMPGALTQLPDWVDPAALAFFVGDGREPVRCWLVQDAAQACLLLQAQPAGVGQTPLGDALTVDAGGVRLRVGTGGSHEQCWLSAGELPVALAALGVATTIHLETATETITVAAVPRPRGAREWACAAGGLRVRSVPFGDIDMQWHGDELRAVSLPSPPAPLPQAGEGRKMPLSPEGRGVGERGSIVLKYGVGLNSTALPPTPLPQAGEGESPQWRLEAAAKSTPFGNTPLHFGLDEFGVWAEFTYVSKYGSATQRLRWIEPGSFLMGSPEDEPGRRDNEGPQHTVTITQGYWLFDTPCTQALWQAVMGNNPSRFKSPRRPVERVSWHEVQTFLQRINAELPGLDLCLPTEAQWEQACRAGTGTALYTGGIEILGDNNAPALDPIAWYGGNSGVGYDLPVGSDSSSWSQMQYPNPKSGSREVGQKQANPWGLYDMLGNVWEWCADGYVNYGAEAETDPQGPTTGAARVVRGGSWYDLAWFCRCAFRDLGSADDRDGNIGFRCARVQVVSQAGKTAARPSPGQPQAERSGSQGEVGAAENLQKPTPEDSGLLERMKNWLKSQ